MSSSAAHLIVAARPARGGDSLGPEPLPFVAIERTCRSISEIRSSTGSSFQALKTTGRNFLEPLPSAFFIASSRIRAATPARSSELFPTPLSAYRSVSGEVRRCARMIRRSVRRPKNHFASASV